ncbi:SCO4848 family membrane protein [Microbacterium thalli]|uniref:Integral membrane protein n=1 Tax=Microbacterium thalli TaxID=3027921 RepID=A0ABT5SIQ5_9MICO|nr:hypothetical protein [Microbacterium thalli]MDD7929941.1 hypothetical protein [Microbacterium thalli]MDD7962601.1 hypothetical protein [Microbacterium thalli]MDN8549840.1 hypothetical protein [Microbacterium thalli]
MTPFLIAILIVGAAFNVITWPTFLRRVARDPRATDAAGRRTRFYTVHLVLVVIALLLAALFVLGAVLLLTAPA